MQSRTVFGGSVVLLVAGCFDGTPPAPVPQDNPSAPLTAEPVGTSENVAASSDRPTSPRPAHSTPATREPQPRQPQQAAVVDDTPGEETSLEEMAASVGRVLFGKSRQESAGQPAEQAGDASQQPASALGAVGRALSKAAMEAAREGNPNE